MSFNNLDELYEKLLQDQDYIANECGKMVGEVLHDESKKIYKEYIPSNPKVAELRRYTNGGFADKRNIKIFEPIKKGNKCSITVRNITEARGKDKPKDLDYYIEYGIYSGSSQAPARPVYARTINRIKKEKIIQKAINKALEDKGWK